MLQMQSRTMWLLCNAVSGTCHGAPVRCTGNAIHDESNKWSPAGVPSCAGADPLICLLRLQGGVWQVQRPPRQGQAAISIA